jgi:hypothetical protein
MVITKRRHQPSILDTIALKLDTVSPKTKFMPVGLDEFRALQSALIREIPVQILRNLSQSSSTLSISTESEHGPKNSRYSWQIKILPSMISCVKPG